MRFQVSTISVVLLWTSSVTHITGYILNHRVRCICNRTGLNRGTLQLLLRLDEDSMSQRSHSFLFASTRKSSERIKPTVVNIENIYSDLWQIQSISKILLDGGMGVICTDTCYSFVTLITSTTGVSRLMKLKSVSGQKKPLSLLCRDLSMASLYTQSMNRNWVYKVMKAALPGPFTFILPSSKLVPQMVISGKVHSRRWKRKEVGIRIPDDPVVVSLFEELSHIDLPLLSGSVPTWNDEDAHDIADDLASSDANDDLDDEQGDAETGPLVGDQPDGLPISSAIWPWYHSVDFIVDAGKRGGSREELSTVVDLTGDDPVVLRSGRGVLR